MKDKRVAPKGWPSSPRARENNKSAEWHRQWTKRHEHRAEFRPEGRKEPSDYNIHHLDVDPPPGAEKDYFRRSDEITVKHPDVKKRDVDPDPRERLVGAVISAAIGDAFGEAVATDAAYVRPWEPSLDFQDEKALTEYVWKEGIAHVSGVSQLVAFTLEGLIRAHVARRMNPRDNDPAPEVQHAYQRWLYTITGASDFYSQWRSCGGVYAQQTTGPDGWLVRKVPLYHLRTVNEKTFVSVIDFAEKGGQATLDNRFRDSRGGDVVPWVAVAAVWSNSVSEVFATAVNLAVLTHSEPDDFLPGGALAVILHQQLRGVPFADCLSQARSELERWPGNEKTLRMMDRAFELVKTKFSPTEAATVRETFGEGADGAEALGIGLYVAMSSDYVREAALLSMNYTEHRSVVGAISGFIIGAEYGIYAVPRALREPLILDDVLEMLCDDALVEFSPNPPTEPYWTQRYPAW